MAGAGSKGQGQGEVSVIRRDRFEQVLERKYGQARQELYAQAEQLLQHDKIRRFVQGACNAMLSQRMPAAIQEALKAGSTVIKIEIPTAKAGRAVWNKWPNNLRQQVAVELVILAVELLFVEAGYSVKPVEHMMVFEKDLAKKEVDVVDAEGEEEEGEEEGDEESLESAADGLPELSGPTLDDEGGEGAIAG